MAPCMVQHASWDRYGWDVMRDGKVLATFATSHLAQAYADYLNAQHAVPA